MTDVRMTKARTELVMEQPFFGSLAMRLQLIEAADCETMATDGRRLLYNPRFLDELTPAQIKGVIVHEVEHCALMHHTRRGNRDRDLWNVACDYAVNRIVTSAGFELPSGALLDPQYDGLGAEKIYRILEQSQKQQQQQQQQQEDGEQQQGDGEDAGSSADDGAGDLDDDADDDGKGDAQGDDSSQDDGDGDPDGSDEGDGDASDEGSDSATGDGDESSDASESDGSSDGTQEGDGSVSQGTSPKGDPGRCGEILDAAPDYDEASKADEEAKWEVAVRQALNIAKKQGAGKLPGYLEENVVAIADPQTDWREELRRFTTPSATKDFSWRHPNRRFLSLDIFTPGLTTDGINHVAIIVDTSGSIDQNALRRFGGEAQALLDEAAVDEITVLFVDTDVRRVARYVRGDRIDFTVRGGGGTAFSPAFKWIDDNVPDIAAAIYFTDLDCDDFGREPPYPVLWAAYGDPRQIAHYAKRLPFGECIDVAA